MTATASSVAVEIGETYKMVVVVIPTNKPCIREDYSDLIFTHREAKNRALVREIMKWNRHGRPVLVGTRSVEESEEIAGMLQRHGIKCGVLNAKNDEREAEIIADAGAPDAVTISTNMAGRGTDIRLGGSGESDRERVVALGGLFVIGTNRHEAQRIDNQLRGRAGRQGDPGTSQFFVSLEDPLVVRFGIDHLIPRKLRPSRQYSPLSVPRIQVELDRLQRIVEGQNQQIRRTLARYSALVEKQRATLQAWRTAIMNQDEEAGRWHERATGIPQPIAIKLGERQLRAIQRSVILDQIDAVWAEHLAFVSNVREGIHLVGIGGLDPLHEFHKQVADAFAQLEEEIFRRTVVAMEAVRFGEGDRIEVPTERPASTWTYLVNDQVLTEMQQLLFGHGSGAFSAGAALMTWPLLFAWGLWKRFRRDE
ncbi:MAG: hypothetical protein HKN13_02645 [Rhodothermales bacterium]|nr:hypothetical protein [Rhodothermales bacterium]